MKQGGECVSATLRGFAQAMRSFELSFTSRERILETVVQADPSLLNPDASSSIGEGRLNTIKR